MKNFKININIPHYPELNYQLNPSFGKIQVPILLWADLSKENPIPKETHLEILQPFEISPFSSVLHYGQSIFEGLKSYRLENGDYGIFRPDKHAKRFVHSSKIMSMPEISEDYILETFKSFTKVCEQYIPSAEGHSLYLRPILIGNDPIIKVRSSDHYRYMVMGSIVGSYFSSTPSTKEIGKSKVLVSPHFVRAFPGGTGESKTSSNYAQSLFALDQATRLGYDQVLYLDPIKKDRFQELGGMNFFWVQNGEIFTPKLDGQILHGITRQSILEIAKYLGIKANEETLYLDDLIKGHKDGSITEVFASGTAAVISPLGEISITENMHEIKSSLKFSASDVTIKLRSFLVDTFKGKTKFSSLWLQK
jgi:branched-chain amino acid aminotransferase